MRHALYEIAICTLYVVVVIPWIVRNCFVLPWRIRPRRSRVAVCGTNEDAKEMERR